MRINWFCSLARDGQPVELCQGGAIGSFVTAGVVGPFGLFGPPSLLAGSLAFPSSVGRQRARVRLPAPTAFDLMINMSTDVAAVVAQSEICHEMESALKRASQAQGFISDSLAPVRMA